MSRFRSPKSVKRQRNHYIKQQFKKPNKISLLTNIATENFAKTIKNMFVQCLQDHLQDHLYGASLQFLSAFFWKITVPFGIQPKFLHFGVKWQLHVHVYTQLIVLSQL